MKGWLFLALCLAAVWFGWMKVQTEYLPRQQARDFVEELRLGMDNGVLSSKFGYTFPLPAEALTPPEKGIAANFQMELINPPGILDQPDSRVLTFKVKFERSPVAPPGGTNLLFEYRLVMIDEGTYLMPKWKIVEFRPAKSRPLRRAA